MGVRKRLRDMRRSVAKALQIPNENVVYHRCKHFDVDKAIKLELKRQPPSNSAENFEENNEPQLLRVTGNTVVITDK